MTNVDLKFFGNIQQSLEQEYIRKDEIRVKVRELERTCRQLAATLDQIHSDPMGPVPEISFSDVQTHIKAIADLIPDHQYYKYCDLWSRQLQQAIFLVVFKTYLEKEELVQIPVIEETIGYKVDLDHTMNEFHIQLEDVLHAYISLVNELSRLAINAVTAGDYKRPLRMSSFLARLSAGFLSLNLKNDALRKRFDSIKYDVKKIEEVVYDISLRGLQEDENARKKAKLTHE